MEFRLEERWFVISDPGGEPWALIRQLPNSNIERYLPGGGVWVPRQEMADYLFGEPGARQVLPENWELAKKIPTLVVGVDPDAEPSESLTPAPQSNLAPEFVDERGSATSGGKVHPNAQSLGEMESGPQSADEGGFSEEYMRVISGDMTHEEYTEWYESTRRD
ncbi:hypothetical protein [Dermacoccus barathri]|uniref:hypothetical protein n=1 Tax=Dermacoccus barathri TaxID=322601 RepID=UPI00187ABE2D|nr:hypothetical protein [Dermacoccus barathri]MBE7371697.1 hypothetical protein [Dermacoccus barathri]